MSSEPFFEEQSDAVKMSETPYPTNGSGKNLAKDRGIKYSDLCTHVCPIASQARHFSPSSEEADTKEKRNHYFYRSKSKKY